MAIGEDFSNSRLLNVVTIFTACLGKPWGKCLKPCISSLWQSFLFVNSCFVWEDVFCSPTLFPQHLSIPSDIKSLSYQAGPVCCILWSRELWFKQNSYMSHSLLYSQLPDFSCNTRFTSVGSRWIWAASYRLYSCTTWVWKILLFTLKLWNCTRYLAVVCKCFWPLNEVLEEITVTVRRVLRSAICHPEQLSSLSELSEHTSALRLP